MEHITFKVVNPCTFFPEVKDNITDYWRKAKMPYAFKPNLALYHQLYQKNWCFGVSAFVKEDLAGFGVVVIQPSLHNHLVLIGANDIVYVKEFYQNKGVGSLLMRKMEREAVQQGASFFTWAAPTILPLGAVIEKKKFYASSMQYATIFKHLTKKV